MKEHDEGTIWTVKSGFGIMLPLEVDLIYLLKLMKHQFINMKKIFKYIWLVIRRLISFPVGVIFWLICAFLIIPYAIICFILTGHVYTEWLDGVWGKIDDIFLY